MSEEKGMYCKVCKDAGHPRSVYTSHYVKDRPGGKIVCPHLLSLKCRHCGGVGHTVKYCTAPPRQERVATSNVSPSLESQRKRQKVSLSPRVSLRGNNPYEHIANLDQEDIHPTSSWARIAARPPIQREQTTRQTVRSPSPSPSPSRYIEAGLDWAAIMSSDGASEQSVSSGPDSIS